MGSEMCIRDRFREPSGRLVLAEVHLHPDWVARPVADIESAVPARVAYVTRTGEGVLVTPTTLVQDGDLVHLVCAKDDLDEITRTLDQPLTQEDVE